MPSAEIIAIGSELLLGETLDTNTQFLLQNLRSIGIDVFRTMIIGDNPDRISQVIREALNRTDIVITTGGLGPTVDDPTRSAVAMALDCELVYLPELWDNISDYFCKMNRQPTLNNKKQAYIPSAAEYILNPTGTAPAFYAFRDGKFLVSLPGVPKEMMYLFTHSVIPLLDKYYHTSSKIVMRNLHSYGIGESVIDEMVGDLEETANPSLGLCAKSGQIDLRITAKAEDMETAEKMADEYEQILRDKLGNAIFGRDADTLNSVVNNLIESKRARLRILEINSGGRLSALFNDQYIQNKVITDTDNPQKVIEEFQKHSEDDVIDVILIINSNAVDVIQADVYVKKHNIENHYVRSYNLLTVDENDWLLWALNAIRLLLLEQQ